MNMQVEPRNGGVITHARKYWKTQAQRTEQREKATRIPVVRFPFGIQSGRLYGRANPELRGLAMLDRLRRLVQRLVWGNDPHSGETLRMQLDSGQFDDTVELADSLTAHGKPEQYAEMQPFDAAAWEAAATARIERRLSELCGLPLRR